MRATILLAWRYVTYHRIRSLLLSLCVALVLLLPLAMNLLVGHYAEALTSRARSTPLLVGARGSRFDLVLNSLYFQGRVPRTLPMAETTAIQQSGLGQAIPLYCGRSAQGFSIVGTSYDYFGFRGLRCAAGELPVMLGEAVVGAAVATELGLAPGASILSDRGSLYDLAAGYPLKMHVVGVLAATGSPDDRAVFVDVRTAWIIEGIGHGHDGAAAAPDDQVLERGGDAVVFNASVIEFMEVTEDNVDEFHFHGEAGQFPLTAVLVVPRDDKGRTLLKGRYRVSESAQMLVPAEVVDEILGFVLKVKRFFDANLALVTLATTLFLVLIVLLSFKVREREMETLFRIGCARGTVARVMATELLLQIVVGASIALLLAAFVFGYLRTRGLPFV